jgi:DNA replication protein DnaC
MTDTAVCPLCEGTGWRIVERAGLSGAARCSCYGEKRARELKETAGIPPNYEHVTLENFEIPRDNPIAREALGTVLRQVKRFVKDFPSPDHPGLLLTGDTGVGKTHLAVAAMKALLDRGHECVFFDYQNLLERIRSGWDRDAGASDKEAYRAALDTEVVVLDELGAHRAIDWIEDTITSIITYRCNQRKPLIVTTNLPDEDAPAESDYRRKTLGEVIGQRARSRLHEMCRVVKMPAIEDYRLKRAR